MSLKQELESWVEALGFYEAEDYSKALEIFEQNADTSKIYFNIGMIHATQGNHEKAVEAYARATKLDSFLAVAYFQMGVSNFLLGEFGQAMANFNEALLYLRGNTLIDYEQLGLKFRLYSCEVLFNRGLCYIYNGEEGLGMKDLEYAAKEKQVEDHQVIDEAISEHAEGYTVFSVGVGTLYRPNEDKVRNVKTKDYLGKARLIAASDEQDAFTGFSGAENKKQESKSTSDAMNETSYAATNLVKTELTPRRQSDSEQSMRRDPSASLRADFPPTPPPDNELIPSKPARANTVTGSGSSMNYHSHPARDGSSGRDRARLDDSYDPRYGPRRLAAHGGAPSQPQDPRRAYSTRDAHMAPGHHTSRSRSVRDHQQRGREPPQHGYYPRDQIARRPTERAHADYSDEVLGNPYSGDLLDMYAPERRGTPSRQGGSVRRGPGRRPGRYDDDDEYASDAYEGSDFDDGEFEMMDSKNARRSGSRRPTAPDVKKIKVKAHHGPDTRMILISAAIEYKEFVARLKEKFGLSKGVRCKIKDEDGDGMISLSDQEDLDLAISSSKDAARQEGAEFGKLEIWVYET